MSMRTKKSEQPVSQANPFAIGLSILIGIILFGVAAWSGEIWLGTAFLAIMLAFAALLHWGSRYSDTIAVMSDDVSDERNVSIHQRAALYTLNLLMAVIVGAFIVDFARGGDGSPYTWLAAVGAITYVLFLFGLSRRS